MGEWAELLITYNEVEAEIIKNILNSEDIPFVIDSSKIRPYPVNIGRIGEIKILVKNQDLFRAKELISIMKNERGDNQ
jgi:hypothetical protein